MRRLFDNRQGSHRVLNPGCRGAALVEALLTIPVFIVVISAMIYTQRLYSAKQQVTQTTRERAWTEAADTCHTSEGGMSELASQDSSGTVANAKTIVQRYGGPEATEVVNTGFALTTPSTKLPLARLTHYEPAQVLNVSSSTKMMCNEKSIDVDVLSNTIRLYGQLAGW